MKDYRLGETTWQFLIEKFDVIFYYCESLGTGLPLIDLIKMGAKPVEPDEPEFEEIEKLPNGTFSQGYPDDVYAVRISQLIRNQNKLIAKIKELEGK